MARPRTRFPKISPPLALEKPEFEAALEPLRLKGLEDLLRHGAQDISECNRLERARIEWIGNLHALHTPSVADEVAGQHFIDLVKSSRICLQEQRALILYGEAGSGKSHILRRFERISVLQARNHLRPYVKVLLGPVTTAREFWGEILMAFMPDHPALRSRGTAFDRRDAVFKQAASFGTRILIIDEAHNIAQASTREQQGIHAALKAMLTHPVHPMAMVMAGLPAISSFIAQSDEVHRRAKYLGLHPIDQGDEVTLARFLEDIERQLGFPKPSNLVSQNKRDGIYAHAGGLRGRMVDVIVEAGKSAFGKRDQIDDIDLKRAFHALGG